jgi:hypothetical protein
VTPVHDGSGVRLAPTERHVPVGERASRLAALGGLAAGSAYLALVDPSRGGAYPLCPSRLVLGLDCPLCGGLRGTHDLLHGRVLDALDHNLLLPGLIALLAVALVAWLAPLAGRPVRSLVVPAWAKVAGVAVVAVFTVARNLPIGSLDFLASGA